MSAAITRRTADLPALRAKAENDAAAAEAAQAKAQAAEKRTDDARDQAAREKETAANSDQVLQEKEAAHTAAKEATKVAKDAVAAKKIAQAAPDEIKDAHDAAEKAAEAARKADEEFKLAKEEATRARKAAREAEAEAEKLSKDADVAEESAISAISQATKSANDLLLAVSPGVNFYDAETLKPLDLEIDTLELSWVDAAGEECLGEAQISSSHGRKVLVPPDDLQTELLKSAAGVQVRILSSSGQADCVSYVCRSVSFLAKVEGDCCCCVPVPWSRLDETSTLTVTAYDCSKVNFAENAKYFLDNVDVKITAVKTPAAAQDSAYQFRHFSYSGKTKDGKLEVTDLPREQLYLISMELSGYIATTPALQQVYISCEPCIELTARFEPCGIRATRSLVFVSAECRSRRWVNGPVDVAGTVETTGIDGVVAVRDGLEVVDLKYPGHSFTPSHIDFGKSDPVVVVAVAEHPAAKASRPSRAADDGLIVLDFERKPPMGTEIEVKSASGEHITNLADDGTGLFKFPVQRSNEQYLFVVRVGGRVVDQALLTS